MFGFNKPISVKEYLERYNHLISSGSFVSKEAESILKKIESTISDYLHNHKECFLHQLLFSFPVLQGVVRIKTPISFLVRALDRSR